MAESESSLVNQLKTLVLTVDSSLNCNNTTVSNSTVQGEAFNVIHRQRLLDAIRQQELERNDSSFSRDCLLCRKHFTGNRSYLFQHLMDDHHLYIGQPDNLVYVDEYLDTLSEKLNRLQCFFCEKVFKDWMALNGHMRKKKHKRLNTTNPVYDKYFIINYLEPGKKWKDMEKIRDFEELDDDDENNEIEMMEAEGESEVICLFCSERTKEVAGTLQHMEDHHRFDFKEIIIKNNFDFYAQVRLINYIRHQVAKSICPVCEEPFPSQSKFLEHMLLTWHSSLLPCEEKWNGPMFFYFPVIENDMLIISLEDEFFQPDSGKGPIVIPEDILFPQDSVLMNEQTRQMLL